MKGGESTEIEVDTAVKSIINTASLLPYFHILNSNDSPVSGVWYRHVFNTLISLFWLIYLFIFFVHYKKNIMQLLPTFSYQ